MNEGIIDNWNSVVKEDDTVWLVGDAVMGKIEESLPLLDLMYGHKFLVLGNHDRPFPSKKKKTYLGHYNRHFEWIGIHKEMEIGGRRVELNHFPFNDSKYGSDRWDAFRPAKTGQVLLHGHTHRSEWDSGDHQIHVGIDASWEEFGVERYHPIPESAITKAMYLKGY